MRLSSNYPNPITVNQIILVLTAFSLSLTVTNFVVLSCVFTVSTLMLAVYWKKMDFSLSKVQLYTLILLAYFLLSTILYSPKALFNYNFYRRDGNVFITFLPLIVYGSLFITCNIASIIKKYVIWVATVNLIGIFLYHLQLMANNREYCFFFYAHNAAGGFLCCILGLSIVMFLEKRTTFNLLLCLINVYGAYITQSRGSFFGLIASLVFLFVLKGRHAKKIVFLSCASLALLLSYTYPIWHESGMKETSFVVDVIDPELFDRVGTVVDRGFFLWPRALYLWLQSPFLGTGFGSYNDVPYNLVGTQYLFMWNLPTEAIYSDAHCHHSFLQVLAETGLVGIFLLTLALAAINRYICQINNPFIKSSLQIMFWTNIWSAFTEHRLFTPSQVLPFTLLLGMVLASENSEKFYATQAHFNA